MTRLLLTTLLLIAMSIFGWFCCWGHYRACHESTEAPALCDFMGERTCPFNW